jgi:hypothetical protein
MGCPTWMPMNFSPKVARIHLDEMVDPNYVVVASIEKKFLAAKNK